MDVKTIAGIILAISIGCYALHLYLVFRQIRRQTSILNRGPSQGAMPDSAESRERLHKIVHTLAGPPGEPLHEENQEED